MTYSNGEIWLLIVVLGIGTYAIRFSFLGLLGNRPIPILLRRALRYVGVAILPGLVAPLVIWPEATGGQLDTPRLCAALVAVGVGFYSRNTIIGVIGGFVTLYVLLYWPG